MKLNKLFQLNSESILELSFHIGTISSIKTRKVKTFVPCMKQTIYRTQFKSNDFTIKTTPPLRMIFFGEMPLANIFLL